MHSFKFPVQFSSITDDHLHLLTFHRITISISNNNVIIKCYDMSIICYRKNVYKLLEIVYVIHFFFFNFYIFWKHNFKHFLMYLLFKICSWIYVMHNFLCSSSVLKSISPYRKGFAKIFLAFTYPLL